MSSGGSVTAWIGQLQDGEEAALAKLHRRYWPWLVELARKKMKGARLHAADEEDVAQQAFWNFYRTFKAGSAPRLASRQDFLALLTTITACKAVNQIQHEAGVQKRGGGRLQGESALLGLAELDTGVPGLEGVAAAGRTPAEEAILKETYRHFLEGLPPKLRDFAELYLADCTQREIAEQLQCGLRTVERKIALILAKWHEMAAASVSTL
jgi:RNA polymerase sigma factor (sigma-70 family)